jgi:hypothetical protein
MTMERALPNRGHARQGRWSRCHGPGPVVRPRSWPGAQALHAFRQRVGQPGGVGRIGLVALVLVQHRDGVRHRLPLSRRGDRFLLPSTEGGIDGGGRLAGDLVHRLGASGREKGVRGRHHGAPVDGGAA